MCVHSFSLLLFLLSDLSDNLSAMGMGLQVGKDFFRPHIILPLNVDSQFLEIRSISYYHSDSDKATGDSYEYRVWCVNEYCDVSLRTFSLGPEVI